LDHGNLSRWKHDSAAGKRASATIHLAARHSGASVLITVADDGGRHQCPAGAGARHREGFGRG